MTEARSLRYLTAEEVSACLPPLPEQLGLAEKALIAVGTTDLEMPPKVGIHPRAGCEMHAMPACLKSSRLVGVKWIATYPNNAAKDLPPIDALIVLNDANTGAPQVIMDGALLTAVRTAATSGVAIRMLGAGRPRRAAILGAGLQAKWHVHVLAGLLEDLRLRIFDTHQDRAMALARMATELPAISEAVTASSAREAVTGAGVVVSVARLGSHSQLMRPDWLHPDALVLAVDADTYASAELARSAAAFIVDDRERFRLYLQEGRFRGFPEPSLTIGEAARTPRVRDSLPGRLLVVPLGTGIVDIVFANAVWQRALAKGMGVRLAR